MIYDSTQGDMLHLIGFFGMACSTFDLAISLKKTPIMHQPALNKAYSSIYVYAQKLAIAEKLVYLSSSLNMRNTLDDKISFGVRKACNAFGKLDGQI